MKRSLGHVRPAKIRISLRIRAVWSESSLSAFWIANDAGCFCVDNEDSDYTARMIRPIWHFFGCTSKNVCFGLNIFYHISSACDTHINISNKGGIKTKARVLIK